MKDGRLWICAADGLYVFEYNEKEIGKLIFRTTDQVGCNSLTFIGKRVYVAALGKAFHVMDLHEFNTTEWIDETRNLADNLVYSVSSRNHLLFAGTNSGLSVLDTQIDLIRNQVAFFRAHS